MYVHLHVNIDEKTSEIRLYYESGHYRIINEETSKRPIIYYIREALKGQPHLLTQVDKALKIAICANCNKPVVDHCTKHLVPCCPGKCSLDKETKDDETQQGRSKKERLFKM